jgi:Ca-activated chloride channel homolog
VVFADPWIFSLALGLASIWLGLWFVTQWRLRKNQSSSHAALRFSSIDLLKRLAPSLSLGLRRLVILSRVLTIAFLVIAMARPQTGRKHTQISAKVVDIILAIDTSGSMQALDLDADRRSITQRRNRLEVVKSVVEEFVIKRESDQLGLVVFGTEAFTQCPLTLDHGIVASFIQRIELGMAGDATAIGNAIGIASKRLKKSDAKTKILVLLTDGRQTAGSLSPRKAAEIAKSLGIKIYTVAAGTRGKAPFVVDTLFGKQVQMQDVAIDEEALKDVATITGGRYYRAEDAKALSEIYDEIDKLERTEIKTKIFMEYDEKFSLFVYPAVFLLLLEILLLGTRLRKIP